jgi:hypothetical protein
METETTTNPRQALQNLVNYTGIGNNNEALKSYYCAQNPEITTFATFAEWKKKGYNVKKGSKGFIFWSSPIKTTKEQPDGETKEGKFFKVCYLFSNCQVQPIAKG